MFEVRVTNRVRDINALSLIEEIAASVKLLNSGGHLAAAGGAFSVNQLDEFLRFFEKKGAMFNE